MEDSDDYLKLPLEEQLVHKNWKARLHGYESAIKLFSQLDDKSPEFNKFGPILKKFVVDSNAVAQVKGIEAVTVFMCNSHSAGRFLGDVVSGIVNKAIAAPKTNTRNASKDLVLMCVEIEKYEVVLEELVNGFAQKNPKVVASCINMVKTILSSFGHSVLNLKALTRQLSGLMEHKDKQVREETKCLIVELHRWIGPAIQPHLRDMKPVQISELEQEFAKLSDKTKPVAERYLRSDMLRMAQNMEQGSAEDLTMAGDAESDRNHTGQADELDPMDLLDPVDILAQLPAKFGEQLESKKWQERKEQLSTLHALLERHRRLEQKCDYGELVRALRRVLSKDTNVMLVALAAQCFTLVVRGLRKAFSAYTHGCLSCVLDKFREKKLSVVAPLRELADALFQTMSIEAIQEDVCLYMANKNPSVRAETLAFLARALCYCTPDVLTKKLIKAYLTDLLKLLADSDPTVRDATFVALGTMMRVTGEKVIAPFIADVDKLKLEKIKEQCDKVEMKVKIRSASSVKNTVTTAATLPTPKVSNTRKKPLSAKVESNVSESETIGGKSVSRSKTSSKSATNASIRMETAATSEKNHIIQRNTLKKQRFNDEAKLRTLKWSFVTPRAEFVEQLQEQMSVAGVDRLLIGQMFHSDFKQHLKALESLHECVKSDMDAVLCNLDLLLKWLTLRFFDTNPTVIMQGLQLVQNICKELLKQKYTFAEIEAVSFLPYLIIKLGDSKDTIRSLVRSILRDIHTLYAPAKIFSMLMEALKSKNSRQRAECIDELHYLIDSCGLTVCSPSPNVCLKEIARQIGDKDATVRKAALNLLVLAHLTLGDKIFKMIGQISKKDVSLLEERIKRANTSIPASTSSNVSLVANSASAYSLASKTSLADPVEVCADTASAVSADPPALCDVTCPVVSAQSTPDRPVTSSRSEVVATTAATVTHPSLHSSHCSVSTGHVPSERVRRLIDHVEASTEPEWLSITRQLVPADGVGACDTQQAVRHIQARSRDVISRAHALADRWHADFEAEDSVHAHLRRVSETIVARGEAQTDTVTDLRRCLLDTVRQLSACAEVHTCRAALSTLSRLMLLDGGQGVAGESLEARVQARVLAVGPLCECLAGWFTHCLSTPNSTAIMFLKELTDVFIQTLHISQMAEACKPAQLNQLFTTLFKVHHSNGENRTYLWSLAGKLILNLAEFANHTHVFCVIVSILQEAVVTALNKEEMYSEDFQNLLMKCLWRTTSFYKDWAADDLIDMPAILLAIHNFFTAIPVERRREINDKCVRTVRTCLHTFIVIYGFHIVQYMFRVPNFAQTETYAYIKKVFATNGHQPTLLDDAAFKVISPQASTPVSRVITPTTPVSATAPLTSVDRHTLISLIKSISPYESNDETFAQLSSLLHGKPALVPLFTAKLADMSEPFQHFISSHVPLPGCEVQRPADTRTLRKGQLKMQQDVIRIAETKSKLPPIPSVDAIDFTERNTQHLHALLGSHKLETREDFLSELGVTDASVLSANQSQSILDTSNQNEQMTDTALDIENFRMRLAKIRQASST